MENSKKIQIGGGGFSLCTVLFLVFLILKLTGVIAWSWWLVFLPLIIYAGLIALVLLFTVIVAIIAIIMDR
jgi:hypothetical protein